MVAKKDGTTRQCRDYLHLNERTSGNAYPIPHIHDFASGLSGCQIFSKIDLVKGYHQIPVRVTDVLKMAIATPFGLFEFTRMPFGFKNAAQTFQRLMDNVSALRRFRLVLNINKCIFGMRQLEFLGHSISSKGISPLPEKVEAVQRFE